MDEFDTFVQLFYHELRRANRLVMGLMEYYDSIGINFDGMHPAQQEYELESWQRERDMLSSDAFEDLESFIDAAPKVLELIHKARGQ